MNRPLEKRLEDSKQIFADMCAIKSTAREWYLAKQYNRIRKIKRMIENREPIHLFDVGGSSTTTEGLSVVGGVTELNEEISNEASAT